MDSLTVLTTELTFHLTLHQVDFSAYERKGHEQDAIFDSTQLQEELGYVPRIDVRTAYNMRDLDV